MLVIGISWIGYNHLPKDKYLIPLPPIIFKQHCHIATLTTSLPKT
jgi:hypothetical protein